VIMAVMRLVKGYCSALGRKTRCSDAAHCGVGRTLRVAAWMDTVRRAASVDPTMVALRSNNL